MMMPWFWPWGVIPIKEKELKELTEKAENWDEWLNSDIGEFTIDCSNKLEAVRNWIEKQPQYGEGGLEELEKILESS